MNVTNKNTTTATTNDDHDKDNMIHGLQADLYHLRHLRFRVRIENSRGSHDAEYGRPQTLETRIYPFYSARVTYFEKPDYTGQPCKCNRNPEGVFNMQTSSSLGLRGLGLRAWDILSVSS